MINLIKKSNVTIWTIIALVAGIVFGCVYPHYAGKMHILSVIFLRMIKMILAPLLFSTLVIGIAGHDSIEVVTTIALFLGLGFGNLMEPGYGMTDKADPALVQLAQSFAEQGTHESLSQ